MLKRLIVCATGLEIEGWLIARGFQEGMAWGVGLHPIDAETDLLITGVGAASCACMVGQHLGRYGAFYHVGFAGAYAGSGLEVGECVVVEHDAFAHYALQRAGAAKTIERAGFNQSAVPDSNGAWVVTHGEIPEGWKGYRRVSGLTVEQPSRMEPVQPGGLTLAPSIETMEGAAFGLAMASGVGKVRPHFASLRVVSNLVAEEAHSGWDIPLAKARLAQALGSLVGVGGVQLSWAYSSCPNDTFIFAGIAQRAVAEGICHSIALRDIAELNASALAGQYDVVKVSAAFYPRIADRYEVLPVGGALGYGVGPLLVSGEPNAPLPSAGDRVLVPGYGTTAHGLLRLFCPDVEGISEALFSEIASAVSGGASRYGVLIHEGRFTYQQLGLHLVADLGALWEERYALPLPLGVICVRRALPLWVRQVVSEAIRRSLLYAWGHRHAVYPYVREHAQELHPAVQSAHIHLYVNGYTYDLGSEGESALRTLHSALA